MIMERIAASGVCRVVCMVVLASGLVQCRGRGVTADTRIIWSRSFGGHGQDHIAALAPTADGGCVLVGRISDLKTPAENGFAALLGTTGDTLWSRIFPAYDTHAVKALREGGFVIAASSRDCPPGRPWPCLIKLDNAGSIEWVRQYQEFASGIARDVIPLSDDGFAYTGWTWQAGKDSSHDVLLVRTDLRGDVLWSRTFGGDGDDFARKVMQNPAEDFILIGSTTSYGSGLHDFHIVRTDKTGQLLWSRTHGTPGDDFAMGAVLAEQGQIIIAGYSNLGGDQDKSILVARINPQGDALWSKRFLASPGKSALAGDLVAGNDDRYAIVGTLLAPYERSRCVVIEINQHGDSLSAWIDSSQRGTTGAAIIRGRDGGYIVASEQDSPRGVDADFHIFLIDPNMKS